METLRRYVRNLKGRGENLGSALDSMSSTLKLANALGFEKPLRIQPLRLDEHNFASGVAFDVSSASRSSGVLAVGGRSVSLTFHHTNRYPFASYDHLFRVSGNPVSRFSDPVKAVAVQIALDRVATALAEYQRQLVPKLVKEQRSFGYDEVYLSFQ